MYSKFIHAAAAFALLASAGIASGQTAPPSNPSQFDVTGIIQAATLDPTCTADRLCGGTITVNNQVITVPRNTVLQMPAAALTWQDVFFLAPAPYGIGATTAQSGLAQADVPAPLVKYEAHVVGNRVVDATGDRHIAGLIFLSQRSLQSGQGFINSINYTTGELRVGGTSPTTGQRVKINDPLGRFGIAGSPDVRFTIDENNPTVRAATGFPMCIPRTDPAVADDALCPQKNRKDPATGTIFSLLNFPPVGPPGTTPFPLPGPDPRSMAPFEVGDYVTYSGVLLNDAAGLPYISAYQVIGNVGLFTAPGDALAYIATDVMLLGVGGASNAGATEATVRTRFEGWTTDPARNVRLYGVDVDPCLGTQSLRDWGSIDVDPGPPTGAALGRWRFRPPSKVLSMPAAGVFIPATREMRSVVEVPAALNGGVPGMLAAYPDPNNASLTLPGSGYYQAPIFEFLFPENAGVGKPIVPNNFEGMPFLALGSGPLDGTAGNPIVSQLNPWPLGFTAPPLAPTCGPPKPPVVTLSAPASVAPNATFTATATASDPNVPAQPLTYKWTVNGVAQASTTNTLSVKAPGSGSVTVAVTVTNTVPLSASASAIVTVSSAPTAVIKSPLAGTQVVVGQAVTLDSTGSLNASKVAWTVKNAAGTTLFSSTAPIATYTVAAGTSGTLTVTLTVTNGANVSATSSVTISVSTTVAKPVAVAGVIINGVGTYGSKISVTVPSNTSMSLDASQSTPTGVSTQTYTWTVTGGGTLNPASGTVRTSPTGVTYTAPTLAAGAKSVNTQLNLTVTNSAGSSTAQVNITVTAPVPPPDTITFVTALSKLVNGKQRLTVDVNSSADPLANPAGPNPTMTMQAFDATGKALFGVQNMPWTVPPAVVAPVYDVTFVGSPTPAKIVVKSSFGGVAYACLPGYVDANCTGTQFPISVK